MLQRNFGFKTKLDIVWPSDFSRYCWGPYYWLFPGQASQAVTSPSALLPRRGDALPPWDLRDYISRSRSRSPSYHVWAAELGTTRVFTHACIWQVEHALSLPCPNMGSMPGTTSSYHDIIIWGPPFCISCSRNVQCSMNVEDCVISKICNGNSIMVNTVMLENYKVNCWDIWLLCNLIIICNDNSIMINTVMLENYKVNCWDIWLLCNIDGTGPLCLARPTL